MDELSGDYEGFYFKIESSEDKFTVDIEIRDITKKNLLWYSTLLGLWKNLNNTQYNYGIKYSFGDYQQHEMYREASKDEYSLSFTALFHNYVRDNNKLRETIKNLYSTSTVGELNANYSYNEYLPSKNNFTFTDCAKGFWKEQVKNKRAEYIAKEERYKAIFKLEFE